MFKWMSRNEAEAYLRANPGAYVGVASYESKPHTPWNALQFYCPVSGGFRFYSIFNRRPGAHVYSEFEHCDGIWFLPVDKNGRFLPVRAGPKQMSLME